MTHSRLRRLIAGYAVFAAVLIAGEATAKRMKVLGVGATGPNTVVVEFSRKVGRAGYGRKTFRIPGLPIARVVPSPDQMSVLLFTDTQRAEPYILKVRKRGRFRRLRGRRKRFMGEAPPPEPPAIEQPPVDTEPPSVIGASSADNTTVVVTFDEAMGDSALVAANYAIGQEHVNADAGALRVVRAAFTDDSHTIVALSTLAQNEVLYRLTVNAVRDLAGNPLRAKRAGVGEIVDPRTATFRGTPPDSSNLADTDGDGLSDHVEQLGWLVSIVRLDGSIDARTVTSDPTDPDTDDDLLLDGVEKVLGIDPRNPDSDGDGLADDPEFNVVFSDPARADTDGDGLPDALEFEFFRTSAVFADTDGDQISDTDEINLGRRNPLAADLPQPRIAIGNVNLTLDTRFDFTDAQGMSRSTTRSTGSTLSQSENRTFATSDEQATKFTGEVSAEFGFMVGFPEGGSVTGMVGIKAGFERGHTSTFSEESAEGTERAFEESLEVGETVDVTRSVTRTVEGASLLADVTFENVGDVAFSISDFELSVSAPDPTNHRRFVPIASLVPQNPNLESLDLGPLGSVSQRGPFVFNAVQVFPAQVEALMRDPRGLVTQLANFTVRDEDGRSFAFTSQEVFDKTAGISIDFGDGRVESHRVATASTFDAYGHAVGITMAYALDGILGLTGEPTLRDGGNGLVDVVPAGDDVALFASGSAVEPGAIVVRPGPNGALDTAAAGDDAVIPSDWETTRVPRTVNGLPVQVDILTRVRDVETGLLDSSQGDRIDERRRFWVVLSTTPQNAAVDFGRIVLKGGRDYALLYVQDADDDQVYAREEYLYGSSDEDPNTDGCPDDDPDTIAYEGSCPPGTFDLLGDFIEIKEGWSVAVAGRPTRRVFSNPVRPNSDGDGLVDHEERDCGLDPRLVDTDGDGLTDREELLGFSITETSGVLVATVPPYAGRVVLDGGNGNAETVVTGDDTAVAPAVAGAVVVLAGPNDMIDSTPGGDDFLGVVHRPTPGCLPEGIAAEAYATDPLDADTDDDGVVDGAERSLGINPNNPFDGAFFQDSDDDGVVDAIEDRGFQTHVNGVLVTLTSDKFDPDSDDDRLPDLLEHFLGSDPRSADTDGDGLRDFDEFDLGDTCTNASQTGGCLLFGAKPEQSYADFVDACADAPTCVFSEDVLDRFLSRRTGTNPANRDTDGDGLTDREELEGYDVTVGGDTRRVFPDPFDANSDEDGWNDGTEVARGTDATNRDTDADGTDDDDEGTICVQIICRDPLVPDRKVTQRYTSIEIDGDCDSKFFGEGPGDFDWELGHKPAGANGFTVLPGDGRVRDRQVDTAETITLSADTSRSYIASFGDVFQFGGWMQEIDTAGVTADATLSWAPENCIGCDFIRNLNEAQRNDASFTVDASLADTTFITWAGAGGCRNFPSLQYSWKVNARVEVE